MQSVEKTEKKTKKMARSAAAMSQDEGFSAQVKSWPERTKSFITDVRNEMKKVNYPNRKEVQATTVVVIITVFLFGLYFYVIDGVIQFGVNRLLHWATGR